jgi:protein subunit release factor A
MQVLRTTQVELVGHRRSCYLPEMESVIVEIRAGEGGADAKALVREQFAVYARLMERRGL